MKKGTSYKVGAARNAKMKQRRRARLRQYLGSPVYSEMLESRQYLSVSGSTIYGPLLASGTSWTYQVTTAANQTATATRTVVGPAVFHGQSTTEVDETLGLSSDEQYVAKNSSGDLIEYGEDSSSTFGSDEDVYSPPEVLVPSSLTAGTVYSTTYTDTDTAPPPDGGDPSVSATSETDQIELLSETTEPVTVPYSATPLDAYKVHQIAQVTTTDPDGDSTTETSFLDEWSVAGIGIVKLVDSNGNTEVLTAFTTPTEHLAFTQQPVDADKDATLKAVKVAVEANTDNSVETGATGSITLSLNNISGNGTVSGTLTRPLVNGVATFNDLKIDHGGTYTFTAVDDATPTVSKAASSQFKITVPALTWTGAGDGSSWSDPKNWDAGVAPVNGNSLIFPSGAPLSPNNDLTALSIASIDIQGGGYTLSGNAISLTTGLTSEAGNNTYNIDTTLVRSPTFNDVTGDLTVQSILSGGGLTISGSGAFTFDKADTYTGDTTLAAGVTINDAVLSGAFGGGAITIGAGAAGVSIDDTSSGTATLSNDISFADGAVLKVDPKVTFTGKVTLNGLVTVGAVTADDTLTLDGATIGGTGTLTIDGGQGFVGIGGNIAATVKIKVASGVAALNANLLGGDGQVTVSGGALYLLQGTQGTGNIKVTGGVLASDNLEGDGGISGYTGTIDLQTGGTIKLYETKDSDGLGTGTLVLDGGLVQNVSGGEVTIGGEVDLNGNVLLSTPSGADHMMHFSGVVVGVGPSNVTVKSSGIFDFRNLQDTGEGIAFDGTGSLLLDGVLAANVSLQNTGVDVLAGSFNSEEENGPMYTVTVDSDNTTLSLGTTSGYTALSGNNDIDVTAGVLQTDPNSNAPGLPKYTGTITLEGTGQILDIDSVDANGLGTGLLDLKAGKFTNASGAALTIGNDVSVEGSFTLSSPADMNQIMTFTGTVTCLANAVTVSLSNSGFYAFQDFGGLNQTTFAGSGNLNFTKTLAGPIKLNNAGNVGLAGQFTTYVSPDGTTASDGAITVSNTKAVLFLPTTDKNYPAVQGTGTIDVTAGLLDTDTNDNAPGLPDFNVDITLEGTGTINYLDTQDGVGLGTGKLDLKGGAFQDLATANAFIDNPVTIEGDVTLYAPHFFSATRLMMGFSKQVSVQVASTVTLDNGGLFEFGNFTAPAPTTFVGSANMEFKALSGAVTLKNIGEIIVGGAFGTATFAPPDEPEPIVTPGEIVVDGPSTEVMLENGTRFTALSGSGAIDLKQGTVESENDQVNGGAGIPKYTGTITVEGGILNDFDPTDSDGLGTGTIELKGGTLQNSSGADAILNNPIKLAGTVTFSSPKDPNQAIILINTTRVAGTSTINLASAGLFNFFTVQTGAPLTIDGSGDAVFVKSLQGAVTLSNSGRNLIGGSFGDFAGSEDNGNQPVAGLITLNNTNTVLILDQAPTGDVTPLQGTGKIDVKSGSLTSDPAATTGIPGYTGAITLESGGTMKLIDGQDGNGFGKGTLTLKGGLLQSATAVEAALDNPINITGSVQFSSGDNRFDLFNLNFASGGALDLVGTFLVTGALSGVGNITLDHATLKVAGPSPTFGGNIDITFGTFKVVHDNALGAATITVAGTLLESIGFQSADTLLDPVLQNPLVVKSGTLVLSGLLSFPKGVTVKSGATIEISGAGTNVVISGPLTGGGKIIIDNGATLSVTGSQSSFTGSISHQGANAAPAIITNPKSQSVSAGTDVIFTAAASGTPTPTVQWQVSTNGGKTFSNIGNATSTTLNIGVVGPNMSGREYRAVFTNSVNHATTPTATLTVTGVPTTGTNHAPTASISGSTSAVRGQALTFKFSATDPDSGDASAGFIYKIDWGDGSSSTIARKAGNASGVTLNHIYKNKGSFKIKLTATDRHNKDSAAVTKAVSVAAIASMRDPADSSKLAFYVGGTTGNDIIRFDKASAGKIKVTIDGVLQGTFSPGARLFVFAQAGNDQILVEPDINTDIWSYGGDGNDYITGSAGKNVIFGGNGNDKLFAHGGRDIVIGGAGKDELHGDSGSDILIGGSTAYDGGDPATQQQVLDLLSEWQSTDTYSQRIAKLSAKGVGSTHATFSSVMVHDDNAIDTLVGNAGIDWYLARTTGSNKDRISLESGEVVTAINA